MLGLRPTVAHHKPLFELAATAERSAGTLDCAARWTHDGFAKPLLARASAGELDCVRQLLLTLEVLQLPRPRSHRWQVACAAGVAALWGDRALVRGCQLTHRALRRRYERALSLPMAPDLSSLLESQYAFVVDVDELLAAL